MDNLLNMALLEAGAEQGEAVPHDDEDVCDIVSYRARLVRGQIFHVTLEAQEFCGASNFAFILLLMQSTAAAGLKSKGWMSSLSDTKLRAL